MSWSRLCIDLHQWKVGTTTENRYYVRWKVNVYLGRPDIGLELEINCNIDGALENVS